MKQEPDTSRRRFIQRSIAFGVSLSAFPPESEVRANEDVLDEKSNDSTNDFTTMFNLRYPIVQAPTAGPAGPALVIAIAEAGAMGGLPLTWDSPDDAYSAVKQVLAATKGSFFVNYVLTFEPRSLDRALDAGARAVQFSWGMPSTDVVRKIRAAGAKFGIQVTSGESARTARDLGADYLVCQGTEAGGHVHASRTLSEALHEVLAVRAGAPVLASGGIATGHDIRKVISRGAAGAVLGTRFVATQESLAHADYKRALLAADARDTVLTVCLTKGWVNAPHRILRNGTFTMWEAAGCPPEGQRPGERDVVAHRANGDPLERYAVNPPTEGMTGAVVDLGMYAGQGVGSVKDIPAAGDLVRRLWREYKNKQE